MKGYVWIAAAAVVLVAMVGWAIVDPFGPGPECPPDCPPPTPTTVPDEPPPPDTIQISMASSSTKKEWLDQAVETFNALSKSKSDFQLGGKPIEVGVILEETSPGKWDHYRSGSMITDILDDKIKPTIASPAQ